jgi:sister-chromatid-cohesion protein PDS5
MSSKDKAVKALTACCIADILRLFAPDAPYTENELKVRSQTR